VGHTAGRKEDTEVVEDVGHRADRRPRVPVHRLLLDGDDRRQTIDEVDVWLLELVDELAGEGGQGLEKAPLPFGIDRVESER
jgi:hypothetical protein